MQDYDSFYEGEIAIRRELSYPPFSDMVALTLTSEDEHAVLLGAKKLSEKMIEKIKSSYSDLPFSVFGPFEADVYKLNEKYRMRSVVKCRLNQRSRRFFSELLSEFSLERKLTLTIDLNPLSV